MAQVGLGQMSSPSGADSAKWQTGCARCRTPAEPGFSVSPPARPVVWPMTAGACHGIVSMEGSQDRQAMKTDDGSKSVGQGTAERGQGVQVRLWYDLVVSSLLWAGMIAGLISVVRDCMKDRHLKPPFAEPEDEGCLHCCCPGGLEVVPRQFEEP